MIWRTWLVVVGVGLLAFGVVMAMASGTGILAPLYRLVDSAFWAAGPPDSGSAAFQEWAMGVWGATLAGWGAVITLVAREGFARRESWAWWAIALGTALWFVLDTGISAAHGVTSNVAINVVVLFLVAVPLIATWRMAGVGRSGDPWRGGR